MDVTETTMGKAADVAPENACPIAPVVDIVFSRWTTPILWALHEHGRQRFVELERRIATITPKVLTQRLRQLERDGLVKRTVHPVVPPKVEYELTALGQTLHATIQSLVTWTERHQQEIAQAREAYDRQQVEVE